MLQIKKTRTRACWTVVTEIKVNMAIDLTARTSIIKKILDAISSEFLFDSITKAYALISGLHQRPSISNLLRLRYYARNLVERRGNKKLLEMARANFKEDLDDRPLISVIIPTYNRAKILTERAIPSVLKQTYQNFELIVVGDNCTDNTETLVKKFHDKRIKFYNLQKKGDYPVNPLYRWMVAGSVPRNRGLELASGAWIAPLDDDDEFSDDHLELLLNHALQNQYDMVYGILQMEVEPGKWVNRGSYPLTWEQVCHSAVLYSSVLKFLKYDVNAWTYLEPDDWNLWRRMKEAGAKIGFLDRIVGKHFQEHKHAVWRIDL